MGDDTPGCPLWLWAAGGQGGWCLPTVLGNQADSAAGDVLPPPPHSEVEPGSSFRQSSSRRLGLKMREGASLWHGSPATLPRVLVLLLPASCPAWSPRRGGVSYDSVGGVGWGNNAGGGRGPVMLRVGVGGPHQPGGALAPQRQPRTGEGKRAGSSGARNGRCLPTGHRGLEVRGHGGGQAVPMGVRGRVCARDRGALPASPLPDPHAF